MSGYATAQCCCQCTEAGSGINDSHCKWLAGVEAIRAEIERCKPITFDDDPWVGALRFALKVLDAGEGSNG